MSLATLNAQPYAKLCQEAPSTTAGHPIGVGDWRLVVEHVNARNSAGNGARWGTAVWGPTLSDDKWGGIAWDADPGGDVRGIQIERGADEPYGRPRAGQMTLTLADRSNLFSPWVDTERKIRAGSVIRCGLRSVLDERAVGWLPLFCGVVESDPVQHVGIVDADGAMSDQYLDVTVVEPLSELAQVDDNALGSTVGTGDGVVARLVRLLEQDGVWRFGLLDSRDVELGYTLQSTDMAQNRLTEVYLTGDSTGSIVRPDRTGALIIEPHWGWLHGRATEYNKLIHFSGVISGGILGELWLTPWADWVMPTGIRNVAYDTDSVTSGNDTAHIRNDIRYARTGGTQQTVLHAQSRGRHGRRQMVRNDLICQDDATALDLATLDANRWARIALRVESVTVTATGRGDTLLTCAAVDVNDKIRFFPPTTLDGDTDPSGAGHVRTLTHSITPIKGGVHWTSTFAVDFDEVFNLPGEELDEI